MLLNGRCKQEELWKSSVVQLSGQMAVASDTFQRTTTHCTTAARSTPGATVKTGGVNKSRMTGMKMKPASKPTLMFQRQVSETVEDLKNKEKAYKSGECDALAFCLYIVNTLDDMKQKNRESLKNGISGSSNYQFLISHIAPFYETALEPALQILQDHTEARHGWIYRVALNSIAKVINVLAPDNLDHKKTLAGLYRQHTEQELDYLVYLKDFPDVLPFAEAAFNNILWLVSDNSPTCFLDLLDKDTRKTLEEKGHRLFQEIQLSASSDWYWQRKRKNG